MDPSPAPNSQSLPSKPDAEKPSMAEIKSGKVIFRQKPVNFEMNSETLKETVSFREMIAAHVARNFSALTDIPDANKPVIVKLAHESDKSIGVLVKHIVNFLLPTPEDDDDDAPSPSSLALVAVEDVIKSCMSRRNYGLDTISGVKPPSVICVWRWEVNADLTHYLPTNSREKADRRRDERVNAKSALLSNFTALSCPEQETLYATQSGGLKIKQSNNTSSTIEPPTQSTSGTSASGSKGSGTENAAPTPPKKAADPAKALKEQQRLDKKNAKAEKEKKEGESQRKARSLMNNFFSKTRPAAKIDEPVEIPSTGKSDFEKAFKPFVVRKNHELAPVNAFLSRAEKDIIVIDDDNDSLSITTSKAKTPDQDSLQTCVDSLRDPVTTSSRPRRQRKREFATVRDVFTRLSEAEVGGDVGAVRSLNKSLKNRTLFPAKVLIFKDDARPGYFGTWSKTSTVVRPRAPYAQDILAHDYGYDSGDEWEDEGTEGGDNVVEEDEDEPDDGGDAESIASDLDDWLVDDDTAEGESTSAISDSFPDKKRKGLSGSNEQESKRRKVVPLIPFAKGPVLESSVEGCSYLPFRPYQLQLLNDAPLSLDPFSFVSTCIEDSRTQQPKLTRGFVVPEPPRRLGNGDSAAQPMDIDTTAPSLAPTPIPAPKKTITPKTPFPDEHLPYLLRKIGEIRASALPLLVETIYQELRAHKVRKGSIEMKIKEVAEKSKLEKVWTVKAIVV